MGRIDIDSLMAMSLPIMERFAAIEPQPWTYHAILLELVGEIGSLAHLIQHWDGFKRGRPHYAKLADECSDVLFIILRLAQSEKIPLPQTLELTEKPNLHATGQVLKLCRHTAALQDPTCDRRAELLVMLTALGELTGRLGIDLTQAHQREMEIAFYYFEASGSYWPYPQLFRYPLATFHLARLLWNKRMSRR